MVRIAVALLAVAAAFPALAETMNAEAARHFVAGKYFSFTCFEGSIGSGRISRSCTKDATEESHTSASWTRAV